MELHIYLSTNISIHVVLCHKINVKKQCCLQVLPLLVKLFKIVLIVLVLQKNILTL